MSFIEYFDEHRSRAGFDKDNAQNEVVQQLDQLAQELQRAEVSYNSWTYRLKRVLNLQKPSQVRGIYLWGGVGRGKTFMMDLFFEWLPLQRKQRLHFHRFMQLIHAQLTELEGTPNPLQEIAQSFSDETRLLCFDEFFVSDIGDAMVLAELLEALFDQGLTLMATSNTEPKELYKRGLQRQRFLPAIQLIEQNTKVLEIGGNTDYRFQTLRQNAIYQVNYPAKPEDLEQDQIKLLHRVQDNVPTLTINGRKLDPLFHQDGVAGFTFKALCETARNAADYIELARLYHTVVLYDIPILDGKKESAARRFIALVDEFYDRRVNTLFYAQSPIHELYQGSQLATTFERTISRVIEMQSDGFLSEAHRA